MDSLQISTSEKRIPVVRDGVPAGELVFNPNDSVFRERFYKLMGELQAKLNEYQIRAGELEKNKEVDENNIPFNSLALIELSKEGCTYIREQIDYLFGSGTSQLVFDSTMELEIYTQLFEGITPYIKQSASEKVAKYTKIKRSKK